MRRLAFLARLGLAAAALLAAAPARADITLGAVLSLTGPGAGLGIPERNTIALLPPEIAGQTVRWIVADDASDPADAVRIARRMVEQGVDAILGPSTTANSLALLDVAEASGTPFVSLSGSSSPIEPPEGARRWAFKMLPNEGVAASQILDRMQRSGLHSLAQIGFANSLGDGYVSAMEAMAAKRGISTPLQVRYNPADSSVTPQVLRVVAARPDAVFVAASATPATTPIIALRDRGFKGPVFTVQGIAGPDAMRVGGKALDGVMFSAVPVLVAEQLPDGHPVKAEAMRFVRAYEGAHGPGSRNLFGATMWDAFLLVAAGAEGALTAGQQPGTPPFRRALRDAAEHVQGLVGTQGVFTLSPTDHSGAEASSQVMVVIRDGAYRLLPP